MEGARSSDPSGGVRVTEKSLSDRVDGRARALLSPLARFKARVSEGERSGKRGKRGKSVTC